MSILKKRNIFDQSKPNTWLILCRTARRDNTRARPLSDQLKDLLFFFRVGWSHRHAHGWSVQTRASVYGIPGKQLACQCGRWERWWRGGTAGMPCLESASRTLSVEGGFRPKGRGNHGLFIASFTTLSITSSAYKTF